MSVRKPEDPAVEDALQVVRRAGYIPVKEASYRRAQERQRIAEAAKEWAERDMKVAYAWAHESIDRERRLSERCSYLYGLAARSGASVEQLEGELRPLGGTPHLGGTP